MHSFLLIGQSNMAGRGFLDEAREINCSRIYSLRNGRWEKMFRPINPDRSFSGVNLAESFAESYAKKHNADVGLICCADGGTRLEQWAPGELLFDHAVCQARLAQRTSEIAGVLWHQGESDCSDELWPVYRLRLETIIQAFREKLQLPDVPFILGGLGDFLRLYGLENYVHINAALEEIAGSSPNVGFVPAGGLTANPDNLHFNAASLHEFGLRYFEVYERLCPTLKSSGSTDAHLCRSRMELL